MLTVILILLSLLLGAPARAEPLQRDDVLLVGDSVTAGVWFMSLSQTSVRQSWAGQLTQRLGLEVEDLRLDGVYPIDHGRLAEEGFGFLSWRYPRRALPALSAPSSRFDREDERVILGLPGQLTGEFLTQSSDSDAEASAGWTFTRLFLPPGLTAIETIEQWDKRPRWIVLFLGSNDALASLGIVGRATSPTPEQFERNYEEIARRLLARRAEGVAPDHLLLLTLPDVTRLPILQPVGRAVDERGRPLPEGSHASAFLVPFRDRYRDYEVWTPDELEQLRRLVAEYDAAIRRVADRLGATVVDLGELFEDLVDEKGFDAMRSPWFSPDLHHPSHRTHTAIAELVHDAMTSIADDPLPDHEARFEPLPTNADYDRDEMKRVVALNRLALLGLAAGSLPPDPTVRAALELGGQSGPHRIGELAAVGLLGVESLPGPIGTRWVARAALQGRVAMAVLDGDRAGFFPKAGLQLRAGLGFERMGAWHWGRLGIGAQFSGVGGAGWYTRGEWQLFFVDLSSRGLEPDRFEAGVRMGWLFGRTGTLGN